MGAIAQRSATSTQSSVHLDSTVTHTTFFSHARIRFSDRRALFTRTHTPKQRRKTMARSSSINLTAFALVALVAFSALSVASASSSRSLLQTMDFGSILQNTGQGLFGAYVCPYGSGSRLTDTLNDVSPVPGLGGLTSLGTSLFGIGAETAARLYNNPC